MVRICRFNSDLYNFYLLNISVYESNFPVFIFVNLPNLTRRWPIYVLKKASFTTVLKTVTVGIVNDTVLELAFSRTVIEIVNVINAPNTFVYSISASCHFAIVLITNIWETSVRKALRDWFWCRCTHYLRHISHAKKVTCSSFHGLRKKLFAHN